MTVKGIGRWTDKQLARFKEHPRRVEIECALLFLVSFVLEWILSLDTIYTASGRWFAAGTTSFLIESLNLAVTATLFATGASRTWYHFFSAVFGSTSGAMVAVALAA
jgi:hypothetical protein